MCRESEEHNTKPLKGASCMVCYEDIEEANYLEYQTSEGSQWFPSRFCSECVESIRQSQFGKYISDLAKTTCAKEQKRLLERGPPINIHDTHGFPESDGEEIYSLWSLATKQVITAKLEGSLEGEERLKLWEAEKAFIIHNEAEVEEDGPPPSS